MAQQGGNDILIGGLSDDTLDGGGGNDTLVWHSDARDLDGGSGLDTLRLDGICVTPDLTLIGDNRITGVEHINLTSSGDTAVTLHIHDVLALADHAGDFLGTSTQQLLSDGNGGDSVHANARIAKASKCSAIPAPRSTSTVS